MALLITLLAALPAGVLAAAVVRRFGAGGDHRQAIFVVVGMELLFGWAALTTSGDWRLAVGCGLAWGLMVLAVVDIVRLRLPDLLTLPLIAVGPMLAQALPQTSLLDHFIGAAAGYGVLAALAWTYAKVRGREGLGLGDAKLLAAAGAWLGWRALPSVVLAACAIAFALIAARALARGKGSFDEPFPFGLPLCAAFWLTWLYGPIDGALA